MNFWKKCPLLILLSVSGFIISVVSLANPGGIYRDFEKKTVMTPVLAAFFQGVKDEKYPWSDYDRQTEAAFARDPENGEAFEEVSEDSAAETGDGEADPQYGESNVETAVQENTEEETEETAAAWRLGPVEEEYFDDALFIGDSRTQGLYEYGGFGENVTFYCKTSLTVYDLFKNEKAFIREDDKKLTLEQALTERSFGKIYLMIGINEMGTGTAESFFEEYARAVFRIRQLQPEAVIFVQSIMNVGAKKNASDPVFNNMNIAVRNVEIETLADGKTIFYLDVNEVFCDENGNLFDGWTNDQIHLKAKYYAVWKEFLMERGAVEMEAEDFNF